MMMEGMIAAFPPAGRDDYGYDGDCCSTARALGTSLFEPAIHCLPRQQGEEQCFPHTSTIIIIMMFQAAASHGVWLNCPRPSPFMSSVMLPALQDIPSKI